MSEDGRLDDTREIIEAAKGVSLEPTHALLAWGAWSERRHQPL
ncbi:hypothetical protein LBMAG50_07310 [Phycisphaerae bacterium]|nr:hypothetical protein LBMAG50_07310 [Phycisphaerae bacterium]